MLREVAKHRIVEEIHSCEIDEVSVCLPTNSCFPIFKLSFSPSKHMHIQRVIEVSKRYLPQTAVGFSSPKVKVHIQDGAEFMQQWRDNLMSSSPTPLIQLVRTAALSIWYICVHKENFEELSLL